MVIYVIRHISFYNFVDSAHVQTRKENLTIIIGKINKQITSALLMLHHFLRGMRFRENIDIRIHVISCLGGT